MLFIHAGVTRRGGVDSCFFSSSSSSSSSSWPLVGVLRLGDHLFRAGDGSPWKRCRQAEKKSALLLLDRSSVALLLDPGLVLLLGLALVALGLWSSRASRGGVLPGLRVGLAVVMPWTRVAALAKKLLFFNNNDRLVLVGVVVAVDGVPFSLPLCMHLYGLARPVASDKVEKVVVTCIRPGSLPVPTLSMLVLVQVVAALN
jgi:hypothetical protein